MRTVLTSCMQIAYGRSRHLSMQIAHTHKGQAALWVTNGCPSMSKPITR